MKLTQEQLNKIKRSKVISGDYIIYGIWPYWDDNQNDKNLCLFHTAPDTTSFNEMIEMLESKDRLYWKNNNKEYYFDDFRTVKFKDEIQS